MSRIGKKRITIPDKVKVNFAEDGSVKVEGPKGNLQWVLPKTVTASIESNEITLARSSESRTDRAIHGLGFRGDRRREPHQLWRHLSAAGSVGGVVRVVRGGPHQRPRRCTQCSGGSFRSTFIDANGSIVRLGSDVVTLG